MESVTRLIGNLERNGLEVTSVRPIDHAYQIRLACGVIINVYKTGTVLVQGKLDARGKTHRVYLLQKLLPAGTTFPPSMLPEVQTMPLVRDLNGNYVDAESHWYGRDDGRTIETESPIVVEVSATRLPDPSLTKSKSVGQPVPNLLEYKPPVHRSKAASTAIVKRSHSPRNQF
jgi:hypothetical protein